MKMPLPEGDALIRKVLWEHWLHNLLHDPLDDVQRDNDVEMIEFHCLDRLEPVERTVTELMACCSNGRILSIPNIHPAL